MVENAHKHLDREEERVHAGRIADAARSEIILEAAKEVGPSLFFSLLIITVSFLPVFVLGGESGRLFKPLAFTKTFAMAAAAVLSITIIPVLMVLLHHQPGAARSGGAGSTNLAHHAGGHVVPAVGDCSSCRDRSRTSSRTAGGWPSAGRCWRGCC